MENRIDIIDAIKGVQKYVFIGNESDFEEYVVANLVEIFKHIGLPTIKLIERQKVITAESLKCKVDIFVQHEDDSASIIEVKCTNSKFPSHAPIEQCKSIGQLLFYKKMFELKHKVSPRIFLVDTKIHLRTLAVFGEYGLPVSFLEMQNGRVIYIPNRKIESVLR